MKYLKVYDNISENEASNLAMVDMVDKVDYVAILKSESNKSKVKITGEVPKRNSAENIAIEVSLKYLST